MRLFHRAWIRLARIALMPDFVMGVDPTQVPAYCDVHAPVEADEVFLSLGSNVSKIPD